MCQLDRLPADQARELNARYRKDGRAMCSNPDDAADQTPPAGRSPEPYGRDFGSRLPRFFDRAILAIASAVAFVVGWTVRGPEAR